MLGPKRSSPEKFKEEGGGIVIKRSVNVLFVVMLAAALVAFTGCTEKSPESEPAVSEPAAGAGEEISNETTVNESCEVEYTKFTSCDGDGIEPELGSEG